MANNDHNVNRMDKCMKDLKAAKEERKDLQREMMQGEGSSAGFEAQIAEVNKDIAHLVAECNRHHKTLEGHPLATKHFPSWIRSRRWKGEKIKGGRRTRRRRSRRKRRRVRRKRSRKGHRRSRRKRRRFKKRTKKR
jgi:hypothetical protein